MYHNYFGLKEIPFSISVNPRFLFMSARHRDALAHLLYGVNVEGGFVLLTGEVGTGKTTISRALLKQLPENTDIALILTPTLNATELLAAICDELGIAYDVNEQRLKLFTDALHRFLLDNHQRGRNTVLLIDEAQNLPIDALEQVRLLTNLETDTKKLLQIILVGQPELETLLAKTELRQLSQRITARYRLEPLNQDETSAYIRHRLQVAGLPANQELFPGKILKAVYRQTGGVPRLINVLCDRILLGTYAKDNRKVTKKMLKQAIAEVVAPEQKQGQLHAWPLMLIFLIITIAGLFYYLEGDRFLVRTEEKVIVNVEPPQEPQSSTEVEVTPKQSGFYSTKDAAMNALAQHLDIELRNADKPCAELESEQLRCENVTVTAWQELFQINRIAVLELLTPDRFYRYVALVGWRDGEALIKTESGIVAMALQDIAEHWQGNATIIWQPPPGYSNPVGLGESGTIVRWLADQFVQIDQQQAPLAYQEYNSALLQRVKLFQKQYGLSDDGVAGMNTLLKLNEVSASVDPRIQLNGYGGAQ